MLSSTSSTCTDLVLYKCHLKRSSCTDLVPYGFDFEEKPNKRRRLSPKAEPSYVELKPSYPKVQYLRGGPNWTPLALFMDEVAPFYPVLTCAVNPEPEIPPEDTYDDLRQVTIPIPIEDVDLITGWWMTIPSLETTTFLVKTYSDSQVPWKLPPIFWNYKRGWPTAGDNLEPEKWRRFDWWHGPLYLSFQMWFIRSRLPTELRRKNWLERKIGGKMRMLTDDGGICVPQDAYTTPEVREEMYRQGQRLGKEFTMVVFTPYIEFEEEGRDVLPAIREEYLAYLASCKV